MNTTADDLEPRVSLDQRPPKKSRACLHCHVRKVRCNAWEVGIPCTRCRRRNQTSTCVLVGTSHRSVHGPSMKRQRNLLVPNESNCKTSQQANRDAIESCMLPMSIENTEGQAESGDVEEAQQANSQEQYGLLPDEQHQTPLTGCPVGEVELQSSSGMGDPPIREEDVHVRIWQEMSRRRPTVMSPTSPPPNTNRREVIEYHDGVNSMTILGEALGHQQANRLVRIIVLDDGTKVDTQKAYPGLDEADIEYLQKKGALNFPPRHVCRELLRLYFACIYPYAPILDRVKFVQDYDTNQHSAFLLQSILANAAPYAPLELLHEAGYKDRIAAEKSLFTKARLLYDLGCENSQLHLLQGSIMLSSLSFAYAMDKDYRYWLSNAGRIATRMGLHRNYMSETLDTHSKHLFRRIWWVLYNRDTLMTVSGIDNLRRFNDRYCDTAPLTEADWDEPVEIPTSCRDILRPMPRLQIVFMVEYCKLSTISGQFIHDFKTPGTVPTLDDIDRFSDQLASWRRQLPVEMHIGAFEEWSSDNIWVLVLLAMGFRLEAIFCRSVKEYHRTKNDASSMQSTARRQESAMFELSTIIQRASMHQVLHICPLSFMTCASTILAMRIEIALDPATTPRKQLAIKTQIFAELEYLKESCEYWSSLIWTVRMFEAVISRTRLGLNPTSPNETPEGDTDASSVNPRNDTRSYNPGLQSGPVEFRDNGTLSMSTDANLTIPMSDDVFGILPVTDNYDWLQNLFGSRLNDDLMEDLYLAT